MKKKKKKYFKDVIRKIIIYNKLKEGKKFNNLIVQKFKDIKLLIEIGNIIQENNI